MNKVAQAILGEPQWRAVARDVARYVCRAMRSTGLGVDAAALAFAQRDEVLPTLGPWLECHAGDVYERRYGFDREFIAQLRSGSYPFIDQLPDLLPNGVNPDNPHVRAAVAQSVATYREAAR